jgi:hypothetical protein
VVGVAVRRVEVPRLYRGRRPRRAPALIAALAVTGIALAVWKVSARARSGDRPAARETRGISRRGLYEGGRYRFELPVHWNGGLVVFAHGYHAADEPLVIIPPPLGPDLLRRGYAWIASSYRGNGYRPDWGVDDSLALRRRFIDEFGPPRWTILYGQSMGGHVAVLSLEALPGAYQGGLAECGILSGPGIVAYLWGFGAAAEYISGLPLIDAADARTLRRLTEREWPRIMGPPEARTDRGRRFDSVAKHLMGGDLPFHLEGLAQRGLANLDLRLNPAPTTLPVRRAAATSPIRYRIDPGLGLSEAELNANVRRFTPAGDSSGGAGGPVFSEVTGRLTAPLLTLHNTGDAYVPFALEQQYRRAVMAAGAEHRLVQRAVRRPGHCALSQVERLRAFDDLVAWIERGATPEGDDVLASDPSTLGLRWTLPRRLDDPAGR